VERRSMTNAEPAPIPRDPAPADDELRAQIDALDEQAEAVVDRETDAGDAPEDEDGPESGADSAEDMVPSHPAPEPPD
jgi:hypothetical protein